MKGDKLFLLPVEPWGEPRPDEWAVVDLPPDPTIPLPTWASLSVTSRSAHYLAEILLVEEDIHAMLTTDGVAHLRWIEPELERVADEARRLLERLAC